MSTGAITGRIALTSEATTLVVPTRSAPLRAASGCGRAACVTTAVLPAAPMVVGPRCRPYATPVRGTSARQCCSRTRARGTGHRAALRHARRSTPRLLRTPGIAHACRHNNQRCRPHRRHGLRVVWRAAAPFVGWQTPGRTASACALPKKKPATVAAAGPTLVLRETVNASSVTPRLWPSLRLRETNISRRPLRLSLSVPPVCAMSIPAGRTHEAAPRQKTHRVAGKRTSARQFREHDARALACHAGTASGGARMAWTWAWCASLHRFPHDGGLNDAWRSEGAVSALLRAPSWERSRHVNSVRREGADVSRRCARSRSTAGRRIAA